MDTVAEQLELLKSRLDTLETNAQSNKLSMVVFSGDLDKALAAFIIATGAVAMGMEAVMFFTFWGTPMLRDPKKTPPAGKNFMSKMFGAMLPKGSTKLKLSKMDMAGMGTTMMKNLMKQKNVATLEQLIDLAAELEVKVYVCEMSMDLMGFSRDEMLQFPGITYCGVAKFLEEAHGSRIQLFI